MFEYMKHLSKGDRVKLRRAAGSMLEDANVETMGAFYKSTTCKKREYESKVFLAACLLAGQEENGDVPFQEAWKQYIAMDKSDSLEGRMRRLLNMKWGQNFAKSLWRISKMMDRKDIDYEKLVWDIIHWDDEDRSVQKKWLRAIYSKSKEENAND